MHATTLDAAERQREDGDAPPERVYHNCRRVSRLCGLLTAAVGAGRILSKIIAYFLGESNRFLSIMAGGFSEHNGELALMTGVCFLLFGLALTVAARPHVTKANRVFVRMVCLFVILWSSYKLFAFLLERLMPGRPMLYTDLDLPAPFNVPRMSSLSCLLFLNAGLGFLLIGGNGWARRAAAAFMLLTVSLSMVLLLGYAHGVQMLNALVGTPVALLSALVFVVLSVGLLCRVDPRYFPLRPFLGSSARALLLRTFLPVVFTLVLLDALLQGTINGTEDQRLEKETLDLETAFHRHLDTRQQSELVKEVIDADIGIRRRVQMWSYQHSGTEQLSSETPEADELNRYWNALSPAQKWKEYMRYSRTAQRQRMSVLSSLLALASFCAVIVVVSYVSRILGNTIDRAERARDRALHEAQQARAAAEKANEELLHTNRDLSKARDAAETANRAKSQFLANMNHELRTPLNSIILYAEELIEVHPDESDLVADLHIILDRGKHLVKLINDILEHAKLEVNMVKLEPSRFSVAELARDVALTVEPLAEKNGNKLLVDCPPEVGSMETDPMRLKQCLLNMLSNANKFTTNGTVQLRISRAAVAGREWITFRAIDSGIGMTAEQQARIFERFVQADASTTRRYGGTGLGLSISRSLSELMGGELILERSEINVGSTFTLRLPANAEENNRQIATNEKSPPPVLPPSPAALHPPPGFTGKTILIVDDDCEVRELLIRQLSKEGVHAVVAGNGEEALRLARQLHPQVITLDVMMPGMDGWSVLSALKSDPATADIPVVIVSIIDDRNLGFALGAADYVVKPTNGNRIVEILKRFCRFPSSGVALIAEDDAEMREMLRRLLEKEDWAVVEAANGREALECMARQTPALILLDLMMPEMDGFEFLAEVRHHPEWSAIPVVVITAKDLAEEDRLFLNGSMLLSGCVKRVLQKGSFSREELLGQVRQLVARGTSVEDNS